MDFKIGDDFDENGNSNEHKMSKKTAIIIVTVVAIVFGLLVFFIRERIIYPHLSTHWSIIFNPSLDSNGIVCVS